MVVFAVMKKMFRCRPLSAFCASLQALSAAPRGWCSNLWLNSSCVIAIASAWGGRLVLQTQQHFFTVSIHPGLDVLQDLEHECLQVWSKAITVHFNHGVTFGEVAGLLFDVSDLSFGQLLL